MAAISDLTDGLPAGPSNLDGPTIGLAILCAIVGLLVLRRIPGTLAAPPPGEFTSRGEVDGR